MKPIKVEDWEGKWGQTPFPPMKTVSDPIILSLFLIRGSCRRATRTCSRSVLFRVRIVTRQLNHYDKWLLPDVRDLDGDGLDC